ncbi:MAG TPA: ABC transporter ATP-binding protein [Blastocatellia bacterium]|nr:ABC transporter ATP-binding protein [Blastocatellia bacterium]
MIEIEHLTKRFGDFVAVDDLSLEVRSGETFALLGPNGSGKTTTLKCLVGLVRPTSGEIRVQGLNLQTEGRAARRLMSYLPQRVTFPENLTAREVLEFYCRLRKLSPDRIEKLFAESQFDFDGFADKSVGEFSGGMVQRLGLAVACLPDTPILVFDEPTVSLDPEGVIHFRRFLAALKDRGKTIIFSSHALADVEAVADRVGILVGGRLVAVESVAALREEVARRSRLRIRLHPSQSAWAEVARQAGASDAQLEGEELLITSLPTRRWEILEALRTAGAIIEDFATEEPSLEEIYLRYIHEQQRS